jgi:hypothetical protein
MSGPSRVPREETRQDVLPAGCVGSIICYGVFESFVDINLAIDVNSLSF